MTLWFPGLARSRDKLNSIYLQYHSVYDRQIWQLTLRSNWISPILQCQWSTNLAGWWHRMSSSDTWRQIILQSSALVKSRDILNALYLHLLKSYEHHTRQGADFQWQSPTLKVAWPFDHVNNAWSSDNLIKLYLLATKFDRMVT